MFRQCLLPVACAALTCAGLSASAFAQEPALTAKDFPVQPAEVDLARIVPDFAWLRLQADLTSMRLGEPFLTIDAPHDLRPQWHLSMTWTSPLPGRYSLRLTFSVDSDGTETVKDDTGSALWTQRRLRVIVGDAPNGQAAPDKRAIHLAVTRAAVQVVIRRYQTNSLKEAPAVVATETVPMLHVALESDANDQQGQDPISHVEQWVRDQAGQQTQCAPVLLPHLLGHYLIEYRDNSGRFLGAVEDSVYADTPAKPGAAPQYHLWQLPVYRDEQGRALPEPLNPTIPAPLLEPVDEQPTATTPMPPGVKPAPGPETWLHAEPWHGQPPAPSAKPYYGGASPKLLAP